MYVCQLYNMMEATVIEYVLFITLMYAYIYVCV